MDTPAARTLTRTLLCWLAASPILATPPVVEKATFDAIATVFSGERAQEHVRAITRYHRIQGSPMMEAAAEQVVLAALRDAGIEGRLEAFPSDGSTRYQTWLSPLGWDMRGGELWVEGEAPLRLCRYDDVPMCVSTYSKGGTWSGELVDVGAGTRESDYAGLDVKGKVVLAHGYAGGVMREAVLKHGAVGTVIYPRHDDRPEHPDLIRYNGLWTRAAEVDTASGSFQISANQYAMLKARMKRGPVRVRGTIDATLGPGRLTLVHAWIRGTEAPADEVIVTAHLDHPKWSANDNATGSAAAIEVAGALKSLIASGKLPPPRRTLHFLWVPEFFGTAAWLAHHPEVRGCAGVDAATPCVLANLNLDMVGEDTVKTNSQFYMTRAPLSVPSFLDALLADLLAQTRAARLTAPTGTRNHWPAEMSAYAQGSDHDMLLGQGIPASMFWHSDDWTHHSSADTADRTDATELRRVGVLAAAAAYWIASADAAQWQRLAPAVAADRLRAKTARLVSLERRGETRLARRLQEEIAAGAPALMSVTLSPRGVILEPAAPAAAVAVRRGARRLGSSLVAGTLFESLSGADEKWMADQRVATPQFSLALYETLNFMDGQRSSADIADLLTIELESTFTAEWVERLTSILASLELVEPVASR